MKSCDMVIRPCSWLGATSFIASTRLACPSVMSWYASGCTTKPASTAPLLSALAVSG